MQNISIVILQVYIYTVQQYCIVIDFLQCLIFLCNNNKKNIAAAKNKKINKIKKSLNHFILFITIQVEIHVSK